MANPTGFMYQGICYSYSEYYKLKDTLDSQFPIFQANGTTIKAYSLGGTSNITALGRYVVSIKDENAVITGLNAQLLGCDYNSQTFIPSNTNDLMFIIALVVVFALGFSGGMQR